MIYETTDIFLSAYLMQHESFIETKQTSGHKIKYVFEVGNISDTKKCYLISDFYRVKCEIEKMKILGE